MNEIAVVCHRGANHIAPENTYAAARPCIDWGLPFIEVDVRTSKDGVFYILHDPTVDRTTNGTGHLRDLTAPEIDRLDAGSWFSPDFAGEPLPRLEPFLQWIDGRAGIFFDVKDAELETLIRLVYDVGLEQNCFFWFGEDAQARKFRALAPHLSLKINVSSVAGVRQAKEDFKADIVEVGPDALTPALLSACREYELKVMVLEMRNDPSSFRRILAADVDMINLDYPDVFLQVKKSMAQESMRPS